MTAVTTAGRYHPALPRTNHRPFVVRTAVLSSMKIFLASPRRRRVCPSLLSALRPRLLRTRAIHCTATVTRSTQCLASLPQKKTPLTTNPLR